MGRAGAEHRTLFVAPAINVSNWLDSDDHVRAMINLWARQLVLSIVVPNRAEIGMFVAEVVTRWDTKTLVDRLEPQVGKDLQYIRINGPLVGGLIGLTIFMVIVRDRTPLQSREARFGEQPRGWPLSDDEILPNTARDRYRGGGRDPGRNPILASARPLESHYRHPIAVLS